MKKTIFFYVCISSLILTFTSCSQKKESSEKNPSTIELNYDGNKVNWVSDNALSVLHEAYKKNQNDKNQTKYFDVKLEDLKALIWEMETAANSVYKDKEKPTMGIRLYLTQFPTKDSISLVNGINNIDPEYASKISVILSPIYKNNNTFEKFDPRVEKKKDGSSMTFTSNNISKIVPLRNDMKSAADGSGNGGSGEGGTNLNHLCLCPPTCNNECWQ